MKHNVEYKVYNIRFILNERHSQTSQKWIHTNPRFCLKHTNKNQSSKYRNKRMFSTKRKHC